MLFNSFQFGIFFAVLFVAYFSVPKRFQKWLLLIASCYFYMAFVPYYILILFFLITVDYFLGLQIEKTIGRSRHWYFALSIASNIGTLFFFKYFNFFNQNIADLAKFLHWNYSIEALSIILPLGLSFHVFQSLSYVIEVYKGRFQAEKNYATYALYVMFFPQLVAGPIERPAQLLPQLRTPHAFDYEKAVSGFKRMAWGFFKKICIANWLAVMVDFIYGNIGVSDGSVLIVALFAFSIQLYTDFSGYSDIAVGAARVLGIELVENFQRPFFSASTAEFWRRWHVSLSSWFRDYVYFPLAYAWGRKGVWGIYAATIITFMLVGFWHGAGWTYATMGLIFGLLISLGQWSKAARDKIFQRFGAARTVIQIGITFIFASVAFVFFRAPSLGSAFAFLGGLTHWSSNSFWYLHCSGFCANYVIGISNTQLVITLASVLILFIYELIQEMNIQIPILNRRPVLFGLYWSFLFWILVTGYFVPKTFIYFQF